MLARNGNDSGALSLLTRFLFLALFLLLTADDDDDGFGEGDGFFVACCVGKEARRGDSLR